MSEQWKCKCGRTVSVDARPETRFCCDDCGRLRGECEVKEPATGRPRVAEEWSHKKATLADLQRAIREDPLMNAYYVMFLRGDFASFEDFLINLAFGMSIDRKKLIESMMRLAETREVRIERPTA